MKDPGKKFAFILLAALVIPIACAQEAATKPAAPAPALSPSQTLLAYWNYVGRKLTAMAEDFPEDKYDFKPNPVQRSFAEQLLHAANANYFFINPFIGQKVPEGDPKRDQFKTKADVVAFVKKSFADGAALIKQKGDSGMSDLGLDPFSKDPQQVRMSDMAWGFIEHSGEHYGQLVVYYRV